VFDLGTIKHPFTGQVIDKICPKCRSRYCECPERGNDGTFCEMRPMLEKLEKRIIILERKKK